MNLKLLRQLAILCFFLYGSAAFAQTTLNPQTTVGEVLKYIEQTTEYSLFYQTNKLNTERKVRIDTTKTSTEQLLEQTFEGSKLNYKFVDDYIVIATRSGKTKKFTISGYVADAQTGEKLLNANIYDTHTYKGTVSNNYGFYSLTLPSGVYSVEYSFVGYGVQRKTVKLTQNRSLNIELSSDTELNEVLIEQSRVGDAVNSSRMSVNEISVESIKTMPVLLGEADVIKAIQLLPGVQSGTEGSSGFYVRGGGPDQNLILLDGVPVYNANHLFGFMSVFNADAIQSVTLTKGGFPARYGGRLSSVLDIRMKEGNNKKLTGSASVGLISSKFTIEGPIRSENTSFIFSGRRTYADLVARPFIKRAAKKNQNEYESMGYYFYDLNFKLNHKLNNKHRFYLSTYTGKDKIYSELKPIEGISEHNVHRKMNVDWGNLTIAARWNYQVSSKLFCNTTFTYSDYNIENRFNNQDTQNEVHYETDYGYFSGIEDFGVKSDFDYVLNSRNYLRFGVSAVKHEFEPGVSAFRAKQSDQNGSGTAFEFGNENILSDEFTTYFEDDIEITAKLKANIGVHASLFKTENNSYYSVQPRVAVMYKLKPNISLKGAYTQMTQHLHLLSTSTVGLPNDLWLPTTDFIKPEKSVQYALGGVMTRNGLNLSIETYYKKMDNLIEYKEGAGYFDFKYIAADTGFEKKIEFGKGWSYGIEFMLEKKTGKTTGSVAYTLARAMRQFDNISFGEPFPYRYDRRHDFNITVSRKLKENIRLNVNWVFGSGYPITLALEAYKPFDTYGVMDGLYGWSSGTYKHIDSRNNYRMPNYHRLDFGMSFTKQKKKHRREFSFGFYNAYNRFNPYYVDYGYDYKSETTQLLQYSFLMIMPSVSYNIKF